MLKQKAIVLSGVLILLLALSGCAGTGEGSGNNLTSQLTEIVEKCSSSLSGIMGADEATGAHHVLSDMDAQLADVVKRSATATPDIKLQLADIARKGLPEIESAAMRAMNQPGVGEKIGGSVGSIVKHLEELIGT